MKIVELNPFNKNHLDLSKNCNNPQINNIIDESLKFKTEKDYYQQKANTNNINTCVIEIDDNSIKNYCVYTGTKDNRFVQLQIGDINQKKFLLNCVDYAFTTLNAYTITIFTDKDNSALENIGFENLGNDGNITTYIMEREMEQEIGSVRK